MCVCVCGGLFLPRPSTDRRTPSVQPHKNPHTYTTHTQAATPAPAPITMIADLQGSLLGRFRRNSGSDTLSTRKGDRPVVGKGGTPASAPNKQSSSDLVEDLKDVGQKLSRFTAAVLEEEKGSTTGATNAGTTTSGRGIQGSTQFKGLPADFMTKPLATDEATVRGASAVVCARCFFFVLLFLGLGGCL